MASITIVLVVAPNIKVNEIEVYIVGMLMVHENLYLVFGFSIFSSFFVFYVPI